MRIETKFDIGQTLYAAVRSSTNVEMVVGPLQVYAITVEKHSNPTYIYRFLDGRVHQEDELFRSQEEAQAEADHRHNARLYEQIRALEALLREDGPV